MQYYFLAMVHTDNVISCCYTKQKLILLVIMVGFDFVVRWSVTICKSE